VAGRLVHRGAHRLRVVEPGGAGQQHLEPAERLEGLVVQLAGPPPSLRLGRLDRLAQAVGLDRLGGRDRGGRAGREGLEQLLVVAGERHVAGQPVERDQRAERRAAVGQRHHEGRLGVADAEPAQGDPEAPLGVGQPARARAGQHPGQRRVGHGQRQVLRHGEAAGAGSRAQRVALDEQDEHVTRLDERAAALDDELEHAVELGLAPHRARDRGRGLEAAHGALELGAAGVHGAVQARVLDRDRRPVGEDDDRLLVALVERPVRLLGQVQVAPCLVADQDRHAEEAAHRRMAGREAVGARVLAEVVDAQRDRVLDEHAEDAPPARQLPDRVVRGLVDPAREELGELAAVLVEDAQRGVPRARQLARRLEHPVEHDVEVELRQQAAPDLDEADQPVVVAGGVEHRRALGARTLPAARRASVAEDAAEERADGHEHHGEDHEDHRHGEADRQEEPGQDRREDHAEGAGHGEEDLLAAGVGRGVGVGVMVMDGGHGMIIGVGRPRSIRAAPPSHCGFSATLVRPRPHARRPPAG
jgi:hypothetical protein